MSQPTTLKFSKMLILLGDGGLPETFAAPCGLTARTFDFTDQIADLALIGQEWSEKEGALLSCKIAGSGVLDSGSFDVWNDWALSRMAKNVQVQLVGLGTYEGPFLLGSLNLRGSQGERVRVEVSMDSSGIIAWEAE